MTKTDDHLVVCIHMHLLGVLLVYCVVLMVRVIILRAQNNFQRVSRHDDWPNSF